MTAIPELLILADRGHLVAYRTTETGHMERVESFDIIEGHEKLSNIVTDQAGAYGNIGSPGTSSHESMPLINELEARCIRQIIKKIETLVDREEPKFWGFAASAEINHAILDGVPDRYLQKLAVNLKLDLTNSPPAQVRSKFAEIHHFH